MLIFVCTVKLKKKGGGGRVVDCLICFSGIAIPIEADGKTLMLQQ